MYTRTISKLDTTCNVAHLITYLFTDMPSCQRTINCSCISSRTRQTVELNINVDILLYKGLQHVQEAIDDASMVKTKCKQCLKSNENIEYGPHIFIDTTVFTDDRYTKRDKTIVHSLDTIATRIELKSKLYILVGIIHYVKLSNDFSNDSNNHYIAYARCGSHWYEYDDLKKKRQLIKAQTIINPHLIFYVQADT